MTGDLPPQVAAKLDDLARTMPPEQLAEVARQVREELRRRRGIRNDAAVHRDSPGTLAVSLGEEQHQHLAILDRLLIRAAAGEEVRAIVSLPPRSGKSQRLLRVGALWRLTRDPSCRIMQVSGSKSLVMQSSRWVRDELERDGGTYPVRPRGDVRAVDDWQLEGHTGGIFVGSMGSRIIGRGANLLEVDDLLGSVKEAESKAYRDAAWRFLTGAMGRLEPGASVFIVNSRWHPDDPVGRLRSEQPGMWEYHAVPSLAEKHGWDEENRRCLCGDPWPPAHEDPLHRSPGVPLWPGRYDIEALERLRLEMGSHYFAAQHQARPRRRTGGLWREEWITGRRTAPWSLAEQLLGLTLRCVSVDPSASDDDGGDEAGIICGGRDLATGDAVITADLSGTYTPEGWARLALVAACELAATVVYERNLTPAFMRRAFATAWEGLRAEAAKAEADGYPAGTVAGALSTARVELPRLMPALEPVSAKVGKELRAGPVAQRYEQQRVVHAGVFPVLEDQQLTWRPSEKQKGDSPDRLDAAVHLITWLGDEPTHDAVIETPGAQVGIVPLGAGAASSNRYR